MASTSQCPYCGSTVTSNEKFCGNCGAPNESYIADTKRQIFLPKTIDELKEYCAERGMPLLKMRFFIGEDYRRPKAFGIYRDGNEFIVYKNKANGERAIRYRGPDEAHAVNELFLKLLDECHHRGIYPDGKTPEITRSTRGRNKMPRLDRLVLIGFMVFFMLFSACAVYVRDLVHIMGIVIMAWQFLTPVMYSISMVPEQYLVLFHLNPMTGIIQAYRQILYYGTVPDAGSLLGSFAFSIAILVIGVAVFEKLKIHFAEQL